MQINDVMQVGGMHLYERRSINGLLKQLSLDHGCLAELSFFQMKNIAENYNVDSLSK